MRTSIKIIRKRPDLGSIVLVISFFVISSKIAEKTCEELWSKFVTLTEIPRGFDPSSKRERVIQGNAPITIPSGNESTTEAIIIIHGAMQSPRRMAKIYNCEKFQQWDCYLPLLMYHRRDLHVMNKINYYEMAQQLLQDILYVAKQYNKVYCIGHSLGANLLCYLSLQKKLPDKVKLILYAPAIQTTITGLDYILSTHSTLLNKYIVSPGFFNKKALKAGNHFAEHVTPKRIICLIYESTEMLRKMFEAGQEISNDFVSIIILDDARVPAKRVIKLLSKQKHAIKNVMLNGLGHSPHLYDKTDDIICTEVLKAIQLLKEI